MDESPTPKPQVGPVAAMIIIVAIFAIGGLYFFIKQEQRIHQLEAQQRVNS